MTGVKRFHCRFNAVDCPHKIEEKLGRRFRKLILSCVGMLLESLVDKRKNQQCD